MILTWKKWLTFCVIAILALAACQIYSELHLRDFYYVAGCQKGDNVFADSSGDYRSFKNLVQNMMGITRLPWPLPLELFHQKHARMFNPDHPATQDPETIMGLAILHPMMENSSLENKTAENNECCHLECHAEDFHRTWFERLSTLAISLAKDPMQKQKLEQFKLFVESNANIFRTGAFSPTTSQAGDQKEESAIRFGDAIMSRAKRIDPKNLTYVWFGIYPELLKITEETGREPTEAEILPSKTLDQFYALKDEKDFVQIAKSIDEKLKATTPGGKLNSWQSYRIALKEKALAWRDGRVNPLDVMDQSDLVCASLLAHLDGMGDSVKRLCFVAGKLAERGENQLALDLYRHAYRLGEQLMIGEGKDTPYLQFVQGRSLTTFVAENLMAFWAGRGQAEKAMRAKMVQDANQILVKHEIEQTQAKGSDPLGYHESAYENYARASWLTWWLGTTGLIFAGVSLLSVAIYILLARSKYQDGGVLEISYKLLEMGLGVPIFIMVWLAMVVPLDLENYFSTGSLLTWGWAWMLLWIIFIGLLALFSSSESEGIRRSPGRRIWIFTALGVAAGCIVASFISADWRDVLAIGIGCGVIGLGFFIWLVGVMICWLIRRSQEDLISRARANLAFAVCSMVASAVFLIAALVSMPLTRYQQDRYYDLAMSDKQSETTYYAGEIRPSFFKSLPAAMFEME